MINFRLGDTVVIHFNSTSIVGEVTASVIGEVRGWIGSGSGLIDVDVKSTTSLVDPSWDVFGCYPGEVSQFKVDDIVFNKSQQLRNLLKL